MALGAPFGPLGQFVFEQCAQEAARRPPLLVRAPCQLWPQLPDRGQAQFGEHQRIAPGINRAGHAVTSSSLSSCLLGSNAS
jgi:hypothetical protein